MALFQLPGSGRVARARDLALIDRLWRTWSPGLTLDPERRAALHAGLAASLPAPLGYYRAIGRPFGDLRARLRRMSRPLTTPLLQLHGADDGCVVAPAVDDARRFAGPYRRAVIPGVGHFLHLGATGRGRGRGHCCLARRRAAAHRPSAFGYRRAMAEPYRDSPCPCPRCGVVMLLRQGPQQVAVPGVRRQPLVVRRRELSSLEGWSGFVVRPTTEPALKCPICTWPRWRRSRSPDIALDYWLRRPRGVVCDSGRARARARDDGETHQSGHARAPRRGMLPGLYHSASSTGSTATT